MWVLLGLLCAFLTGSVDALAKTLLARSKETLVAWAKLWFALPWLALVVALTGLPQVPSSFWGLVAVMVPLEVTAMLLYLRAIKIGPMSLAVPFLAFTPMFTVVTGLLFLGERLAPIGLAGVLSVAAGACVLHPVRRMLRSPAVRLMVLTSAIYSVTSVLSKRAINLSGPMPFALLYFALNGAALMPLALKGEGGAPALGRALRAQLPLFLLIGAVVAAAMAAHCYGIQRAPVAYFLSIKRLSLLVSVLYGGFLFREEELPRRAAGTALMLAGAALIILGSGW